MQFLLPDLGEGIREAQVLRLLVAEGDRVAADQPLMEVETDKAAVEIPSPVAGRIVTLHAAEGQVVNVGEPLITFESEASPSAGGETAPARTEAPAAPAVAAGPMPGGTPIKPATARPPEPAAPPDPAPVAPAPGSPWRAAPVVRRLARRLGVDLTRVTGTGPRGRILREDVRHAAETGTAAVIPADEAPAPAASAPPPIPGTPPSPAAATPALSAPTAARPGTPGHDTYGPIRRQALTQVRKTIAARMVQSATEIPHVTNFEDADVTDLDRLRRQFNEAHPPEHKRTLLAYVILAVTRALARHPVFNAEFDAARQEIVYKDYVNVGVAVDSERGLVVPVMRGVELMDLTRIAAELKVLATRVKTASFAVEELRGSSFTVSNAGTAGGNRYATPILNYPETALLSLGRARLEPRYVEGELRPRLILPLSHTFDHRAADGGDSARFLADVIDPLERPGQLWL